jgi:hypothetical protein
MYIYVYIYTVCTYLIVTSDILVQKVDGALNDRSYIVEEAPGRGCMEHIHGMLGAPPLLLMN